MTNKEILIQKGVKLINPQSIEIDDNINPDRISGENVVIHSGCKIYGRSTLILSGATIGYEGPATVENCYIGPQVNLAGGYFKRSVFLEKAKMGLGSHVREGTIAEEMASVAHTVGLKQTILFPFVTLGSLINFCDCLMSGGTTRKNHSEVGSSYIHFNYTPNQDKATPSLLGDVPHGVMLNQAPIFLGGQGGLVGPCRIAFGTVVAAGSIYRKDVLKPGKLLLPAQIKGVSVTHTQGLYRSIKRVVVNNVFYIANLMALAQWYSNVRVLFHSKKFPDALLKGCIEILNLNIEERVKKLGIFSDKLPSSVEIFRGMIKTKTHPVIEQKLEFNQKWPEIEALLSDVFRIQRDTSLLDPFLEHLTDQISEKGTDYVKVIQELDDEMKDSGTQWLECIVEEIMTKTFNLIPTMK